MWTETPSPSWTGTIEDCLREQVRRQPSAVAVIDNQESLTYQELFDRSARLATGLVRLGVRRETLVGMAFDRSARAVVTMVAIALAGGAYLPINPHYPVRRIRQILKASGVGLVLLDTCDPAPFAIPGVAPRPVDSLATDEVHDLPSPPVTGERSPLAYVMYTSGSTGEPKGVMVEHAGILRLVRDNNYLELSPATRMLHAAALEFDAATFEIWGALLNGGRLCVVDRDTAVVPREFATALREYEINTCWLTAPLFHQFVDEDPEMFASVRDLITGGDVVSPDHVRRAHAHNPGLRIYNGYGPTENTTFTTVFPIDRGHTGPIPIGRPIAGTTVLVRDGELYTGGLGLARGYLNQPELTAQRFVHIDGERYYRTGDRVDQDPDGLLHFRGRIDGQVKIRGNLVETTEVSAALIAVPGVLDAYTRAPGEPGQDRELLSWAVAPGLTEREIRAAVAETLPSYMCPARVVTLDRLPLGNTGKVDWRALPVPERQGRRDLAELSREQRRMAELWAEVLRVPAESIGPDSGFMDLGGNSLHLGVLLGRLDARLTLPDLLVAQTLAGMAEAVATAGTGQAPVIPTAPDGPSDLHPQQRSLYAIWRTDPRSLAYNVPIRLDIRGPLVRQRLAEALAGVVDRHDALRMRFLIEGTQVRQQPVPGAEIALDYLPDPSPERVAAFVRPFDPDRPVLPRALLVRLGPDHHELYLDLHHIAFDGVSLRVLVQDLLDHHAGTVRPAPPVRYVDAAQWCHDRLAEGGDEEYWLKRFAELPTRLALPTDHPRGPGRSVRGAVARRVLDTGWRARVAETARRRGVTEFAVLLAAYHAMLARLTGQRGIAVGCPVSGRTHPDLEAVIGMFVSTVCLTTEIAPDTSFAELIAQTDDAARGALAHQGYPFEKLVERLGVPHDPSRNPLFDAFFALQNIDFYEFGRGELAVSVDLINPGTTRFDLNLQVYQRPDRLVLDLEYAADLFEASSANYLLDQYLAVLTELVADPNQPVHRVAPSRSVPACDDFEF